MRPPFTPSELARVQTCTAAGVLPRVTYSTPETDLGHARHRFLERVPAVGRDAALAEIADADARAACAALDLDPLADLLDRHAFVAELAMAWDWETGRARELGRGEGRKYQDVRSTEIPGTADAVALVGDDGAHVIDYKPEHGHQPQAARHRQLRLLALMVARLFRRDWVRVQIVRPSEDGAWRSTATFDCFDLAVIAEETKALAHRIVAARLAYEQGEPPPMHMHAGCSQCPSLSFCPAHVEGLRNLVAQPAETALATFQATAMSPEARTRAYHALKAYDAFRDLAWDALRAMAMESPIRVDDEQVWGAMPVNRKEIDGSTAWTVIRDLYGEAEAWRHAEVRVTEAAIKRLVEEKLPNPKRGERGRLVAEILAQIEARDGLRRYQREEVRLHKEKP